MMTLMFAFLAVTFITVLTLVQSISSPTRFHDQYGHSGDLKEILAKGFVNEDIRFDDYRKDVLEKDKWAQCSWLF